MTPAETQLAALSGVITVQQELLRLLLRHQLQGADSKKLAALQGQLNVVHKQLERQVIDTSRDVSTELLLQPEFVFESQRAALASLGQFLKEIASLHPHD